MGAVAAQLERIAKSRGRLSSPGIEHFRFRQPIERIVDFNRIEVAGIVSKPALFGQIFGVKNTLPVVVLIARRADAEFRHREKNAQANIGQSVMAFGGTIDFFIANTFNYPALARMVSGGGVGRLQQSDGRYCKHGPS